MNSLKCLFIALVFACSAAVGAFAQSTALIEGTVRDSSGALVGGAAVTARNEDSGFTRTATTTAQGRYEFVAVPIGRYTVTASRSGFGPSEVPNIVLQVEQQALVDITLSPGNVGQTVTVSSAPSLIQTEVSSVGQVIDNKKIVDLPLNGRDFTQLVSLTPGALTSNTPGGPSAGGNTGFTTVAVSGGQSEKTEFLLDGISNQEQLYNGVQFSPSVDFLQEFRVLSNAFSAEYGRGSAIVVVSTRSGGNQIHGTAFEFLRNDALDAVNYFSVGKPPLRRNQFGGSFGGPIIKDHLFYFLNYEGTRLDNPVTTTVLVPTAAQRSGDLSALVTPATPIVDPATGAPFPNNQIPANQLDGAAQFLLNYVPLPNTPAGLFTFNSSSRQNVDQGNVRGDYQLSSKDSFFARYSISRITSSSPGPVPQSGAQSLVTNATNEGYSYSHVFSPNLINQVRLGYAHLYNANTPQGLGTNYTAQAGILGFDQTSLLYPGFPQFYVGSYVNGTLISGNVFSPLINPTTVWELSDTVTWTKGKHTLNMGVDIRRFHLTSTNAAYSRGAFDFNGQYTGNSLADFLIGAPDDGARDFPRNLFGERVFNYPVFVQDDWKANSQLTLNLGLRWDLASADKQDFAQNSIFDISSGRWIVSTYKNDQINLVTQQVAQDAYNAYSQYIVTAKQANLSNNLQTMSKKTFSPRIGFAFRPFNNDRTVVRAGYGVFFTLSPGNPTVSQSIINLPFIVDENIPNQTTANGTPLYTTENYFNNPFTSGPPYLSSQDLKVRPPYNQEWNLAVQRELTGGLALQIAYVGNKGTHLEKDIPLNYATVGGLPDSGTRASRRPYPQFGNGDNFTNIGNSNYNALQVSLEKRLSSGLTFLSAYTWSKLMNDMNVDDEMTVQNPLNPALDYGLGTQSIKQRSVTSFSYALPVGRGMHYLATVPRPVDLLVGGWRFGGIAQFQSGSPFTVSMEANPTDTDYATRPNQVANGTLPNRSIHQWFDVSAFQVPAAGQIGNESRNPLVGPGYQNWDLSLLKDFHYTERIYAEFRAEAFNTFNHPHFQNPDTDIQSGTAGQILSAGDPRELQVAMKIYF
jgi:Carboxypeptidase regulatory-like domain